jgi:hypothetical protein
MSITQVKVRAKITIGNSLTVETPYVLSFNVNKARGQISTFDASLKVPGSNISRSIAGDHIKIYAGSSSTYNSNVIFSGIVRVIRITPCWDDPQYVFMNVSGEDILSTLRGKKYTRRSTASTASWISIDGVSRKGLRSGKFKAQVSNKLDIVSADTQREGPVEAVALTKITEKVEGAKKTDVPPGVDAEFELISP